MPATDKWTLVDFVIVVLGGLAGAMAFGVVGAVLGGTEGDAIVVLSIIGQYVGHLGVLFLISKSRRLGAASLRFDIEPRDVRYVGLGIVLQIALALAFLPLQELLLPEGGNAQDVADTLSQIGSSGARITAVVTTTFVAPLTEELLFRGVVLNLLAQRSRRAIILISSLVFAAFHLLGVASLGAGVLVFTQIFLVGVLLAYLTLRTDRLGPAIFVHAGFNLLAALILLLPDQLLTGAG